MCRFVVASYILVAPVESFEAQVCRRSRALSYAKRGEVIAAIPPLSKAFLCIAPFIPLRCWFQIAFA